MTSHVSKTNDLQQPEKPSDSPLSEIQKLKNQRLAKRNLENLISQKQANQKDPDLKCSIELEGSDGLVITCDQVKTSLAFVKLEHQEDEEVETDESKITTEKDVDEAVDLTLRRAKELMEGFVSPQAGSRVPEAFESFSTKNYNFSVKEQYQETLLFKDLEQQLDMSFNVNPSPSVHMSNSQITTLVTPHARSWFNTRENQRYIQLMAFVRYGWTLDQNDVERYVWMEPARLSLTVTPVHSNCALEKESIAHTPTHYSSITDKMNQTVSNLRKKGFSADLHFEGGGGPTQATITTPSLIFSREKQTGDQLEKLDIELKKVEFEEMYQVSNVNQVSWTLERRYCKVKTPSLDRLDLTLYDPSSNLSKEDALRMMPEDRCEPFADYVNFGVWKWDNNSQDISFEFTAHHIIRKLNRFRKWVRHEYSSSFDHLFGQQTFSIHYPDDWRKRIQQIQQNQV